MEGDERDEGMAPVVILLRNIWEMWVSKEWHAEVSVIEPVASIKGIKLSFKRANRPNGSDNQDGSFSKKIRHCCEAVEGNGLDYGGLNTGSARDAILLACSTNSSAFPHT